MSKQRKRRQSLNAATPSTPKSKYHVNDNMHATPKTHYIQDDDSDSSPYSLTFSQRVGVEVTWGEKSRSTPFKSKRTYERRDTDSPPISKTYVDVEPATESPKGLYKFLLGWEKRRIATQIEDDVERIDIEPISSTETSIHTNATTSSNELKSCTSSANVDETEPVIKNSPNYKQLLNDSEDMDLLLCSQRIEQEMCNRSEPVQKATASKGFSEYFSDNDDDLLLALDDPVLLDKKLPQKSSFARHKSIAIQPNSHTTASSKLNTGNSARQTEQKSDITVQPVKHNKPSTPTTTANQHSMVRHKSMPSPTVTNAGKKCSAEEIELKRQNALAKLKLRKQRLTKK